MGLDNTGAGDVIAGTVTGIASRDTLVVTSDDGGVRTLRLHGINDDGALVTPDAEAAEASLASLAPVGSVVTFKVISPPDGDSPGQAVVMDPTGASIAARMVLAGHANFTPYLRPNRAT